MTNVRVFYTKTGRMRFISHLDTTRFFTRMLRKSEIPVYYTEGFNKHPYLNFILPLPLGFESTWEIVDFKVTEEISFDEIFARLNAVMPDGIKILKVTSPVFAAKDCRFAEYFIDFNKDVSKDLLVFLNGPSIVVEKKGKKGKISTIDILPLIKKYEIMGTGLDIILPAGNEININPTLFCVAFLGDKNLNYSILRKAILTEDLKIFE